VKHYIAVLFLLLALPVVSADYSYLTNGERNNTCSKEETSTLSGLTCPINDYRKLAYIEYFRIPNNYVTTQNAYLEAYHGSNSLTPQNISLNYSNRFNNTHFAIGVFAEYCPHPTANDRWYSRPFFYNGSYNYVGVLKSYDADLGPAVSGNENYLYDGDTSTGVFNNGGSTCDFEYGPDGNDEARVRELSIYFFTTTTIDVVFTVKNEFNRPVEGAVVTLTRVVDNVTFTTQPSDVTGQVLFEDLNRNYYYRINSSATGYDNFSGLINIIDSSYTITMTDARTGGGSYYNGLFANLTFITSPSVNPDAVVTNFTININSTLNKLDYWGVNRLFNVTNHTIQITDDVGVVQNLTINLSGHDGETILVSYYFKLNDTALYSQNRYYIIGTPGTSNTSITSLNDDYGSTFTPVMIGFLLMIATIIIAGFFSAMGLPGEVTALVIAPVLLACAIFGWTDRVFAGMSVIVLIGFIILQNKGNA
jgi:hypothetical protein